jgi:hypothetical protein
MTARERKLFQVENVPKRYAVKEGDATMITRVY